MRESLAVLETILTIVFEESAPLSVSEELPLLGVVWSRMRQEGEPGTHQGLDDFAQCYSVEDAHTLGVN